MPLNGNGQYEEFGEGEEGGDGDHLMPLDGDGQCEEDGKGEKGGDGDHLMPLNGDIRVRVRKVVMMIT